MFKRIIFIFCLTLSNLTFSQSALLRDLEVMFDLDLKEINDKITEGYKFEYQGIETRKGYNTLMYYNGLDGIEYMTIYVLFDPDYSKIYHINFNSQNDRFFDLVKKDLTKEGIQSVKINNVETYLNGNFSYKFETAIIAELFSYSVTISIQK